MIFGKELAEAQNAVSAVYREFGNKIKIDYVFAKCLTF